ncbi:hypothetical protein FS837_003869 [Tulasnella sp. UAMH 9824]|nr:hypothetical protein FS837_003869 [Tulasnella sp. UAMH 9824]
MDDADLYSDLYGADYDDEPAKPTTEVKDTPDTTTKSSTSTPAPNPTVSSNSSASSKTISTTSMPAASTGTTSTAPKPAPIASFEPPVTNSIATYSSRDGDNAYSYSNGNSQFQQQQQRFTSQPIPGHETPPGETQQVATYEGGDSSNVRPSEMRDEGKMFVGGLNWETTTESLTNYFSKFGEVDACTIMRDGAGRSRGFAFLTFKDPASVNKVMVREHFLDGKIIDPKRAIPRLEHQRTQKLFVGGLAPTVTAETLKKYFSQHGSVVDATVMVDRESGRSKGFGFITFEEGPSLEHLLGHGIVLDGKVIEVKTAQPRHAAQRQREGDQTEFRSSGYTGHVNQPGQGNNTSTNNTGSTTPAFDAQAMANLYQRMMSVAQTGGFMGMGGGMMGMPGMGGMAGGMGRGGMGMGGMGNMGGMGMGGMGMSGMGMGGMAGGMGMGGGMMGQGMGMGRGAGGPMMGGGSAPATGGAIVPTGPGMGGGPPRGPRAAMSGQGGPQAQQGPGGAGPMRSHGMRGQSAYHPYGRG